MTARTLGLMLAIAILASQVSMAAGADGREPLNVSGIYPHLTMYNTGGECGIGAVVPWAGKLWAITYPPHMPKGGPDKLHEIDDKLNMTIRPESVGGTHANRMIHRESNQLIIGPYFIDAQGKVRAADITKLIGRLTATMRHLTDPANMVYFYDMEGMLYEVNVHTLESKRLFEKAVPGWHGKGGYTSQGRVVMSNNGELHVGSKKYEYLAKWDAGDKEAAGVLAEWDGKEWRIVERRQFTDVTGPGGINGAPDDKSPLWAMGWDKRSVILKLLDGGQWSTFRVPKASHTFDPKHGWYTEWPRIREFAPGQYLMVMHGMMFDFPKTFSATNTAGIKPVCSHLRYVTDFCTFNSKLVISSDDTSIMQNPRAGLSQSNMWFGEYAQLKSWGPRAGWGGPWMNDKVKAGEPSQPFLINGFDKKIVHLSHDAESEVSFNFEVDAQGNGQWAAYKSVPVAAKGYAFHVFPADFSAQWIRVKADKDCTATAYFHYNDGGERKADASLFASLADVHYSSVCAGLIRPGKHNRNLQYVPTIAKGAQAKESMYIEVDEKLAFSKPSETRTEEVKQLCALEADFEVDAASVIMRMKNDKEKEKTPGKVYRLPKGNSAFDTAFVAGQPRGIREVASERNLMNIHGTFYEMPRDAGLPLIKPVASHSKQIIDFCTWRGLLVMSGTKTDAKADGQYFGGEGVGLWFGGVDDLWKLGKPVGKGGPLHKTDIKADAPSDPYLMTGYDKKTVQLSHDNAGDVAFTLEVDVTHFGWEKYQTINVPAGQTVTHVFPDGYSAHWIRVKTSKDCKATAQFTYE